MNTRLSLGARFTKGISALAATLLMGFTGHANALVAACGSSPLDVTLTYDVTTTINQPIENIVSYNFYECNAGGSSTYSVGAGGGVFSDYFLKSSSNKPLTGLMIGTTHDLVNDPEGQEHLVLITSDAWANAAAGIAFGALFPDTFEATIIGALHDYQAALIAQDQDALNAAATIFGSFVFGQLSAAFFNLGAVIPGETTTSTFTAIAFSDGQIIGNGIASVITTLPDNPAPVPAPLLLLLAGMIALGFKRSRMG